MGSGYVQLQRMDLALPIGAGLDWAGGADQVPRAGQRARAQALADVDRGQARQGDPLRVADHEVGVAVAVRIDALDVDDPPDRFPAGGVARWAVRRGRGADRKSRRGKKDRK